MSKYLSEEFIAKILDAHMLDSNGAEHYAYNTLKREIMIAPGSDVVEVQRGHWKLHNVEGSDLFGNPILHTWACNCSVCGRDGREETPYCPWCGAEMSQEEV